MENIIHQIYSDVLLGQHKVVIAKVKTAIHQGIPALSIMNAGMIAAMQEVGRRFEAGEYYVPEMLVSARAMQSGMSALKPYLSLSDSHPAGKVAIGTVEGDYHDIGKNLVKMMLEGSGFEVIDLGVNVRPEAFITSVKKDKVDILAMSALITTTMQNMQPVIEGLNSSGLRQQVKVLVGGAPITAEFAQYIGADGFAADASRAVSEAKLLLNK
jgi:5-methyltetrahydrofolate--homocysteine methyltransferase